MQGKLRIGIIGAGGIVRQRHLPALLAMPGVEIVAVSNSTYASSERFCREHLPHATPMKNWADLLALPDLDIIWIGTHPNLHAPLTISALEAGRHVFCQARMGMDRAEAEEMLAVSRRYPHLVTMLCPPPMGLKGDRWVRQILREGRLGKPLALHLEAFAFGNPDPSEPPSWRQREEISGLNVMSLGIYVEVLQRWLGPIRAVSAQTRVVHPLRGGVPVAIPDLVHVLARFEGGALGTLSFSSVSPCPPPSDTLRIDGENGSLYYDFATDAVRLGTRGQAVAPAPIPDDLACQWTVEADFIEAVRHPSRPRPHPDFEDGLAYMRVVQAVAEAAESGREVEIRLR